MNLENSLAYITDIHLDETYLAEIGVSPRDNWKRILESVSQKGFQSIMFGGDIGEANAHDWFFDSLKDFDLRIILGNHDNYTEVAEYLHPSLTRNNNEELYYSRESGDYTFIFLDSSSNIISESQLQWLAEELEDEKQIVIFIHHPVLPVNTFVDSVCPLQNRSELENIVLESGKEITIFCGHYHMDHTQTKGPITQVITPAGSYQMEKSPEKIISTDFFGYRIIHFDQSSINTELVLFD